jgi:SAM-dependent methyltransferase
MGYSDRLRAIFPDIELKPEDLLLLEAFQINYLPDRVSPKEFATLLVTFPLLHRFLVAKYPGISSFLDRIVEENETIEDQDLINEHCQEALWEIADLIVYNKYPEQFDSSAPIKWDLKELGQVTSFEGKVIADVGAGTGRIAFMVADLAETVFAVEPLSSLRSFMKEKVAKKKLNTIFVMDGTLDSIPLPAQSLDILITSNAIGWKLQDELQEIERVVKPGGFAIHLLWSEDSYENPIHKDLISPPWTYACLENKESPPQKLIYSKEL